MSSHAHVDLHSPPFPVQVAPDEAVAHPAWQEARAAVLAALAEGEAVALLGRPGTGKTLLLASLARDLARAGERVRLASQLEAPEVSEGEILLVDEADRLTAEELAALRGRFVLTALPGFGARLEDLATPIAPVTLRPLTTEEIARFVVDRLAASGQRRSLVSPEAVLELARRSGGLVRLVQSLAGAAVFLAEHEDAGQVTAAHVAEAAALRHIEAPAPEPPPPPVLVVLEPGLPAPGSRPPVSTPPRRLGWMLAGLLVAGLAAAAAWRMGGQPATPDAPSSPPVASVAEPPAPAVAAPPQPPAVPEAPARAAAELTGPIAPPEVQATVAAEPAPPPAEPLPLRSTAPPPPETQAGVAGKVSPLPAEPLPLPPAAPPLPPIARPEPPLATAPPVEPDAAAPVVETVAAFRGPVFNTTLNQGGMLSLVVRQRGDQVTIRFHAWDGLIGAGELTGTITPGGRIVAAGQLMMGRNPFETRLTGWIEGNRLTGAATYYRPGRSPPSYSTFTLNR